jgi:hypothetical protein
MLPSQQTHLVIINIYKTPAKLYKTSDLAKETTSFFMINTIYEFTNDSKRYLPTQKNNITIIFILKLQYGVSVL